MGRESFFWRRLSAILGNSRCALIAGAQQDVSVCFAQGLHGRELVTMSSIAAALRRGTDHCDMSGTATARILVVDDDVALRDLVIDYLATSGFDVEGVGDADAFRASLAARTPDLVVLDLMLPGEDGLSLLRSMRAHGGPPVIIASARGDEVDRVVGLEVGADDYLPKPFGPRELLARVRAVLRRGTHADPPSAPDRAAFGPFRVNLASHTLVGADGEINLTTGEFTLLREFLDHPNQVLTRDRLITLIKGYDRSPFDRSIDVRVTRLRRKIEPDPDNPIYLRTIWGEGYLFTPQGQAIA
jgi:DNA-binding response OmpR family regulator